MYFSYVYSYAGAKESAVLPLTKESGILNMYTTYSLIMKIRISHVILRTHLFLHGQAKTFMI